MKHEAKALFIDRKVKWLKRIGAYRNDTKWCVKSRLVDKKSSYNSTAGIAEERQTFHIEYAV